MVIKSTAVVSDYLVMMFAVHFDVRKDSKNELLHTGRAFCGHKSPSLPLADATRFANDTVLAFCLRTYYDRHHDVEMF